MEVPDGQHPLRARSNPPLLRERLAFGAMPVAAAVVRDPPMAAVLTSFDTTPEGCGAAMLDRRHDFELMKAQVSGMSGPIRGAGGTEDIGDLE